MSVLLFGDRRLRVLSIGVEWLVGFMLNLHRRDVVFLASGLPEDLTVVEVQLPVDVTFRSGHVIYILVRSATFEPVPVGQQVPTIDCMITQVMLPVEAQVDPAGVLRAITLREPT